MKNNLNKKYLKEAKKLANIIAKNYKPEKIILYGSAAVGNVHQDSDLDFCIIKKSSLPMRKRIWKVYKSIREDWDYSLPFEPVVFTPQEFAGKKAIKDYFVREILKNGKILYAQSE